MSTNMGSNWLWTDEDIIEFHEKYMGSEAHDIYEYLKKFKQSKTKTRNNQDWGILEIESHGGERRKLINGLYRIYDDGIGFDLDYLLKRNDTKIISVKVLSSGEIFSVGDKIEVDIENRTFEIIGFEIKLNCMAAVVKRTGSLLRAVNIEHIKKRKPVLFITEDGKPVYEGDKLSYVLVNDGYKIHSNPANKYDGSNPNYKYFSTEDAAKEYVNKHQPKFTKKDMEYCWIAGGDSRIKVGDKIIVMLEQFEKYFEQLTKQKINQ